MPSHPGILCAFLVGMQANTTLAAAIDYLEAEAKPLGETWFWFTTDANGDEVMHYRTDDKGVAYSFFCCYNERRQNITERELLAIGCFLHRVGLAGKIQRPPHREFY